MFFTWVARREKLAARRSPPIAPVAGDRFGPGCLRLPAEAVSISPAPAAVAEIPDRIDGIVLGEFEAERVACRR